MKKVLLLSAALFLGLSSFAQIRTTNRDVIATKASVNKVMQGTEVSTQDSYSFQARTPMTSTVNRWLNMEEYQAMTTSYDLQSNAFVANRMVQWADGSIAATANLSLSYEPNAADRGTGYNYTSGSFDNWGAEPAERIESERTGWPSIAQYGANGEIVVSHSGNGLVYYKRDTKGEGAWTNGVVPNPASGQALSWPRVITSGANNEIIHIVAAAQDSETGETTIYYARTEDLTNWDVDYFPEMAPGSYKNYSADNYALSAKGDVVACLFAGSIMDDLYIIKSEDNGLTWEKKIIWDHPYSEIEWEAAIYTDTLYAPENGALTVGNDGVVHVAFSTREYLKDAEGDSYWVYSGFGVDGIMYWNDTQDVMTSPDGNPHHACRLWWPLEGGYIGHLEEMANVFCGYTPASENGYNDFDNAAIFAYSTYFNACSSLPAIAVDADGNIAVAYASTNQTRLSGDGYYFRNVYVSYKANGEEGWSVHADNLMEDFMHSLSEGVSVVAVPYSANVGEFVFSYIEDDYHGFALGTGGGTDHNQPTQTQGFSENKVQVVKVTTDLIGVSEETINPLTSVYPNPATDVIYVNSSMNTDAVVTFYNIAGQTVKTVNKSLTTGENGINVNDLSTGVYFCTINANGYSRTAKVVVK